MTTIAQWGHKHWKWLVAGGTVLVLVLVVGVVVSGDGSTDPSAEPSTRVGQEQAQGLDDRIPVTAPDVTWEPTTWTTRPRWIPTGNEHGPYTNQAGRYDGWARTPTGALLFMAYAFAAFDDPDVNKRQLFVSSHMTGTPEALSQAQQRSFEIAQKVPAAANPEKSQPAYVNAYEFVSYTDTEALIRFSNTLMGRTGSGTLTVRWENDTWKVLVNESGYLHVSGGGDAPIAASMTRWGPTP